MVVDYQEVLGPQRNSTDDAAQSKGNIGFQSGQINLLTLFHFQPTKLPLVHSWIQLLINEQALSNSAASA